MSDKFKTGDIVVATLCASEFLATVLETEGYNVTLSKRTIEGGDEYWIEGIYREITISVNNIRIATLSDIERILTEDVKKIKKESHYSYLQYKAENDNLKAKVSNQEEKIKGLCFKLAGEL